MAAQLGQEKHHVVVIGLGNIGSPLVAQLARIPRIGKFTLVDFDHYESINLASQQIQPEDVGLAKVDAIARAIKRIAPNMEINPIQRRVESVPLGVLRSDLILACLDSKEARRVVNEIAWRLGIPWIDSGVQADGLLARVAVFHPDLGNPCIECGWSAQEYALLEQNYPCDLAAPRTHSTNAPAALGAITASIMALEVLKFSEARWHEMAVGKEILLDARHHQHYVTALSRNPECRFDHRTWIIDRVVCDMTAPLSALIREFTRNLRVECGDITIGMPGHSFARRMTCPNGCGDREIPLTILDRIPEQTLRCAHCGALMIAPGFFTTDRLDAPSLAVNNLDRSLQDFGLSDGDVFTVWSDSQPEAHFELVQPMSHGTSDAIGNRGDERIRVIRRDVTTERVNP